MKMHSGLDAESGRIHSVVCTTANEADVVHAHEVLHGKERQVHGDSGCAGLEKRDEITEAQAEGRLRKDIDWRIAMKRGQLQAMPEGPPKALYEWFERHKAQGRAIVEHPFHVIKNLFCYSKVSYRRIAENGARAKAQAALANLYIARSRSMAQGFSASAHERGPTAASKRCETAS
jgi:IS5 family transposase